MITNQAVRPVVTGLWGWAMISLMAKLPIKYGNRKKTRRPRRLSPPTSCLCWTDGGFWRQGDIHHALARRYFGNGFCSNVPEGVALLSQSLMRQWGRVTVFKRGKQNKGALRVFASTAAYLNTHTNPNPHTQMRARTDGRTHTEMFWPHPVSTAAYFRTQNYTSRDCDLFSFLRLNL